MVQQVQFSVVIGVAAACLLAAVAAPAAAQTNPNPGSAVRFAQDRFAIGFWVDPPLDAKADERYKEIADANFTMVIGGFSGTDFDIARRQLALCEKYDLKAVVQCGNAPADQLPDSPACWGYALRDEPNASDFPALRERVDAIRKARPGKLAYINLFPNYANEKQLGTPTYDEHVAKFCDLVGPDVLSMDHYPIFKPGADGRDNYCANLEVMRKRSLEKNIPFWNFFNTMPYGPHTDPTESQLRWQIYTSIAYGAKGVLYFCYYTPSGGEFPKGGAIIARDDRRTRHWDQAQRINARIKNLGPTLMQLTSTGVYRVKPGDAPAQATPASPQTTPASPQTTPASPQTTPASPQALAGTPIKNLSKAPEDPDFDYLVGAFKHADGRRAVLLNNYHFAYTAWPTVEFDADPAKVREVDQQSGKEVPLHDDSPDMPGLQISLDSGEGRLFLLPAK